MADVWRKFAAGPDGELVDVTCLDTSGMGSADPEVGDATLEQGPFVADITGRRIAVLCPLAPNPILLDAVAVDEQMRMMKVKVVKPDGGECMEWWLSLGAVVTVAVVPKDPPLVQPVTGGVIL